ncbi:phospholipase D/nuclease [Massarina eburnea CBS 473.64]|uniref:Phospholipase D/nuclease n=1 Tax=Massarina eburnea CBS 473.64 TaxID=1395130 RepID=A0A6A6S915_9PLEO|nr:phospholipase D/nuclease [Massarina eburnea CBS 473.64]
MTSSDNDEDLKRAIAMSIADAPMDDTAHIDLVSDDGEEDEDMRRAIALSLGESNDTFADAEDSVVDSHAESKTTQYASSTATSNAAIQSRAGSSSSAAASYQPGLLGLDRKAMEQERLARLGKRKRSVSPERPSKQIAKHDPKVDNRKSEITNSGDSGTQYPQGSVKRTWAHKHPRSNDISLPEVLQASTLNIAVLSAFQWDNVWLFENHLDIYKIKQVWIMSAKARGEDVSQKLLDEAEDLTKELGVRNLRLCFPPLPGQTLNMHGKLMLLVHESHLRVVVGTANMIKFDWGETNMDGKGVSWQPGVMENMVFLIDLPRRPEGPVKELETPFGKNMFQYLKAQEVPKNVVDGILKFDFSETKNFGFVHSIAGVSAGPERSSTGLPCLAKTIRDLKLDQIDKLEIDYAASSLGAIKEPLLRQIYLAACGLPPLSEAKPKLDVLEHFRIYFPSKETVDNSTGGPACGGIITMNRDWYNAPTFPRKCFRDYKSTRPGLLSHNKLLFARGCKKDGTPVAWVYIGSANLSEAAWGLQKLLKSGKEGSSLIRNWECGVVVPVSAAKMQASGVQEGEVPTMGVFEGTVDVPFVFPGEEYGDKEPWFFRR